MSKALKVLSLAASLLRLRWASTLCSGLVFLLLLLLTALGALRASTATSLTHTVTSNLGRILEFLLIEVIFALGQLWNLGSLHDLLELRVYVNASIKIVEPV